MSGWDRSGDVAVEACGRGELVDPEGAFRLQLEAPCDLRVVWEKPDGRAVGPWWPLRVRDGQASIVLPMPEHAELRPLTREQLEERAAFVESARLQLDAQADLPCPVAEHPAATKGSAACASP